MEFHPIASIFPLMGEDQLADLSEDIRHLVVTGGESPGLLNHLIADSTLTFLMDKIVEDQVAELNRLGSFLKRLTMLEAVNAPERLLEGGNQ